MIGTPFVIGPQERAALEGLRDRAAKAPIDMARLMAGPGLGDPARKRRHMRQMKEQTIYLPFGYAVTYSIELNHPGGDARHMSMSSSDRDRVPNVFAMWMVCEILGFVGQEGKEGIDNALENLVAGCWVWPEECEGGVTAINVIQALAGPVQGSRA